MLQREAFDANRHWHQEYDDLLTRVLPVLAENDALRRRLKEQEARLQAVELTADGLGDLISPDLARLAHHYRGLTDAIIEELRARHQDVAEELIEPQIARLEDALAAAKERAWEEHQRAHELDHENRQPRAALATMSTAAGEASPE